MTDLHRIPESTLRRAAHGHHGKSVDVGKRIPEGTVEGTLRLAWTGDTEKGRDQLLRLMDAALRVGFAEAQLVEGPTVRPVEPRGRRHLQ